MKTVSLRFYEELNDFLPEKKRKAEFTVPFSGRQTVKDLIESQGIPHTEIDLILVNSRSVPFEYLVSDRDRISVYPEFELLDIGYVTRLRPEPLRDPAFVLDVHLGKLAGMLRIAGFDSLYRNDFSDEEIARIARKEKRIVLTRDVGLLKRNAVERGYWLRSVIPAEQCREVVRKLDLKERIRPFHRCSSCNGIIKPVAKKLIEDRLLPNTKKFYDEFFRCSDCLKLYWRGSHHKKLLACISYLRQ